MNLVELEAKDNFGLFVRYDDGVSGKVDLSKYAGRGVLMAWMEPGVFEQVRLADAGYPEWPGRIDLCPDTLYLQLTGKHPEEVFQTLTNLPVRACAVAISVC